MASPQKDQSISVGLRVRPLNSTELGLGCDSIWRLENSSVVEASQHGGDGARYSYDHVFEAGGSTSDIHSRMVLPILGSCLEGFNGSLFAYGQTSSGKTYTLLGTPSEPGIIVLSVHDLYDLIAERSGTTQFLVRASYYEIYNERVRDLITGSARPAIHCPHTPTMIVGALFL